MFLTYTQNLKKQPLWPTTMSLRSYLFWFFWPFFKQQPLLVFVRRCLLFTQASFFWISFFIYRWFFIPTLDFKLPQRYKYDLVYLINYQPTIRVFFNPRRFLTFFLFFVRVLFLPPSNINLRLTAAGLCLFFKYKTTPQIWI